MSLLTAWMQANFPLALWLLLLSTASLICGLSSSPVLKRFPMRFPSGKDVATYSHTDEQVRFIARFSLLTGCAIGGILVGVIMSALNG